MHIWYKFVCHECKEVIDGYVDTPSRTEVYLSEWDAQIYEWLHKHCGCDINLVSEYKQDELFSGEYRFVSNEWNGGMFPKEFYKKIGVNNLLELKEYDEKNEYYDGYYGEEISGVK